MHRVHSMEIEVRTTAATVAESLLPRVSRMHARRLAPTLERVLHEPPTVHPTAPAGRSPAAPGSPTGPTGTG